MVNLAKNCLIMPYYLQQLHLKLLQKEQFKNSRSNLISNKIADKIIKVSRTSQKNNSETVRNGHDKEIPKERLISPEEMQKIIDHLRLI